MHRAPVLCHVSQHAPARAVRLGAASGADKGCLWCGSFCAGGGKGQPEVQETGTALLLLGLAEGN